MNQFLLVDFLNINSRKPFLTAIARTATRITAKNPGKEKQTTNKF